MNSTAALARQLNSLTSIKATEDATKFNTISTQLAVETSRRDEPEFVIEETAEDVVVTAAGPSERSKRRIKIDNRYVDSLVEKQRKFIRATRKAKKDFNIDLGGMDSRLKNIKRSSVDIYDDARK